MAGSGVPEGLARPRPCSSVVWGFREGAGSPAGPEGLLRSPVPTGQGFSRLFLDVPQAWPAALQGPVYTLDGRA